MQKVKMVMVSIKSNKLRSKGSCLDSMLAHKTALQTGWTHRIREGSTENTTQTKGSKPSTIMSCLYCPTIPTPKDHMS